MTLPVNQTGDEQWLSNISAPVTGGVATTPPASATPTASPTVQSAASGAANVRANIAKETSSDMAAPQGQPKLTQAAQAANNFVDVQNARVQAWNSSGLNTQLSQLLASGDYAGAFAAAAQSGQLGAMLDPINLKQIVPGGAMTKVQFQQYYQAFAPYQNKLAGSSMSAEGFADTVWNSYSSSEAIDNWNASQQTASQGVLGGFLPDLPDPAQFGHSNQPSDLEMSAIVVGMGLAAVVPALGPEVGAALGTSAAAGSALVGGGAGALTGFGKTGTVSGAVKGAAVGAIGGGLAGGGAQALSSETGIPAGVINTGAAAAKGAITGGGPGAVAGAVTGGLESEGVPGVISQYAGYQAASELSGQAQTFGTTKRPPVNIPAALSSPGAIAAGATMASPTLQADPTTSNPMSTVTQGMPAPGSGFAPGQSDPTTTGTPTSGGGNDFLSGLTSFLSSPGGNLAEFATLGGVGLAEANAQKKTNDQLASSLGTAGAPFTTAGQAELSQLTGGPQMGGPMGSSIAQQTGAAANLGQVAQDYSTGKLTDAQNTQVQQYITEQKQAAIAELSNAGITDPNSEQYRSKMQQIDDNAAVLTQQLTQSNIGIATSALSAVQGTYTTLLNQALGNSEFGFSTQQAAVQTQIASDTQLSGSLMQLFAGIAQGYGNAIRPSGGGSTPVAGGATSPVSGQGSSGVASTAAGGGTSPQALRESGGANSGIAAGGPPAADQTAFDQSMASNDQAVQSSIDQTQQQSLADLQNTPMPADPSSSFTTDLPAYVSDPTSSLPTDPFADPFGGLGG